MVVVTPLRREPPKAEPEIAKRPSAPPHLSPDARAVWRRSVRAMPTWAPAFAESLSLYAELRAQFDRDPAAITSTKLVTLRLLARDLGLSPGTVGLAH